MHPQSLFRNLLQKKRISSFPSVHHPTGMDLLHNRILIRRADRRNRAVGVELVHRGALVADQLFEFRELFVGGLAEGEGALDELVDGAVEDAVVEGQPHVERRAAERVVADRPDVVGFTSTFQQNVPALSSYFELMDDVIPRFLNVLSTQKVRGTRVLLK